MSPNDTLPVQVSKSHGVIAVHAPLYLLTLQVPAVPDGDHEYPNAWLALIRTNECLVLLQTSEPPHRYDFWSLLLDYTPGMERECGALFLIQECFTLEEMRLIRAYFERHPWEGATLIEEPVCTPVPWFTLPLQVVHASGPWLRCKFDQHPDFDCPVAFEGYFNPKWSQRVPAAVNTGQYRTPGGHA